MPDSPAEELKNNIMTMDDMADDAIATSIIYKNNFATEELIKLILEATSSADETSIEKRKALYEYYLLQQNNLTLKDLLILFPANIPAAVIALNNLFENDKSFDDIKHLILRGDVSRYSFEINISNTNFKHFLDWLKANDSCYEKESQYLYAIIKKFLSISSKTVQFALCLHFFDILHNSIELFGKTKIQLEQEFVAFVKSINTQRNGADKEQKYYEALINDLCGESKLVKYLELIKEDIPLRIYKEIMSKIAIKDISIGLIKIFIKKLNAELSPQEVEEVLVNLAKRFIKMLSTNSSLDEIFRNLHPITCFKLIFSDETIDAINQLNDFYALHFQKALRKLEKDDINKILMANNELKQKIAAKKQSYIYKQLNLKQITLEVKSEKVDTIDSSDEESPRMKI